MLLRETRDERGSYALLSLAPCDRLAGMSEPQLYGLKLWFVNRSLQDLVLPANVCVECGHVELPPIDLDELL
jgi:hypothetical protein